MKLIEIYKDACETRFNEVFELWGDESHRQLFPLLMELVCNRYEESNEVPSPMALVDNFLVNGSILTREDEDDEEWEEVCKKSLCSTDRYALIECVPLTYMI